MSYGIKRFDLQALAEAKFADASLLYQHRRFSNAYYLSGYAIEIALKASVAIQFAAETLPDPKFVRSVYTHQLKELVGLAGLTSKLNSQEDADPQFAANWTLVSAWTEEARYQTFDEYTTGLMLEAVGSDPSGILPWLRKHW